MTTPESDSHSTTTTSWEISLLENFTLIFAVLLCCESVIVIVISKQRHKHKSKQVTLKHSLNRVQISGDDDINVSIANNNQIGNVGSVNGMSHNDATLLPKVRKYTTKHSSGSVGINSGNHTVAVVAIAFEIFDLYTDIAYVYELISYGVSTLTVAFICSLVIALLLNSIIALYLIRSEMNNNSMFAAWFYSNFNTITAIIVLLLFTDIGLFITIFTSQLFGDTIFYCPLSIHGTNIIQRAAIFSVLFEHLPQFIVQICVYSFELNTFTIISFAALTVNVIDMIFDCAKAFIWMTIKKNN